MIREDTLNKSFLDGTEGRQGRGVEGIFYPLVKLFYNIMSCTDNSTFSSTQ